MPRAVALLLLALPLAVACDPGPSATPGTIQVRRRVDVEGVRQVPVKDATAKTVKIEKTVEVKPKEEEMAVVPAKSAIIVCDMWNDHWCKEAAKRTDALAKQAAPLIEAARKGGAAIIHAPSDTMDFYKENKARLRTLDLKVVPPPVAKDLPNPPLPIDDSDGGCDDCMPVKSFKAWSRQHEAITIDEQKDFIADKGTEVWNILAARGIETVFILGVHTNMCVLNRSFGIKQLKRWGVSVVLVRDLTDAMYNPKKRPMVSHDRGTQLVVEYIERNWAPTTCSKELFKLYAK